MSSLSPPERLLARPRALLVGPPTPVQRLERFERAMDSPAAIFMKRDDAIPFGFGGNKVRKHASSSGGTQGGLLAGLALAGLTTRVVGISADERTPALREIVETLEQGVLDLLGSSAPVRPAEIQDAFVGEGYGLATGASHEAQALLARSEAIVVDHTYTAKALAGLIALARNGSATKGASVLFWHTGGQVGVLG